MLATLLTLAVSLPAAPQDPARERLEASPRHHEWVELERGERKLACFVAYPEVAGKVPAVLVIHENKGLTDWVRSVADRLAEAGYIAIAPDLLSGAGPEGGRTDSFESTDAATRALYALETAQVLADLDAAADHATKLPACDGTLFVAGFCWGGSRSFQYATHRENLKAAFVFYGSAPTEKTELERISCPVYGFYGENDARVNASVPATVDAMEELGKTYEPKTYAGAGHGFMRAGEGPEAKPENARAMAEAWERVKRLLAAQE
jgi:carboxymethylenebutenolidase